MQKINRKIIIPVEKSYHSSNKPTLKLEWKQTESLHATENKTRITLKFKT